MLVVRIFVFGTLSITNFNLMAYANKLEYQDCLVPYNGVIFVIDRFSPTPSLSWLLMLLLCHRPSSCQPVSWQQLPHVSLIWTQRTAKASSDWEEPTERSDEQNRVSWTMRSWGKKKLCLLSVLPLALSSTKWWRGCRQSLDNRFTRSRKLSSNTCKILAQHKAVENYSNTAIIIAAAVAAAAAAAVCNCRQSQQRTPGGRIIKIEYMSWVCLCALREWGVSEQMEGVGHIPREPISC